MTKKPTVKTLRNKADALWSQLIRSRDGRCQRCLRQPPEITLQAAHVLSRRYKAIRWDERNGVALCLGCHHWAHHFPVEFDWFVQKRIGRETYECLREEAICYVGELRRIDLEDTVAELKSKLVKGAE